MTYDKWLFLAVGLVGFIQGIKGIYDLGKLHGDHEGWKRGWEEANELHESFDRLKKQMESEDED